MSRHEHLPIYKKAYDLCLLVHTLTDGFPQKHRYTLGNEMKIKSIHMVSSLIVINSLEPGKEKNAVFDQLFVQTNQLLLYFRLAKDMGNVMTNAEYEKGITLLDECSRQGMGWKKSMKYV